MDVYRSIIITGGGGMLAHALAEQLRRRGHSFHALARADCDITVAQDVGRVFDRLRPSLVLNCAAHTGVDLCEDEPARANAINGAAVGHLATCCREYNARLVHYSTDFVFDGESNRPYRTMDAPHPVSAYGASKLLGETAIQQTDAFSWLIIRTAWLFGRHGDCFPKTILKLAKAKRPLTVVNDQVGCPTYTCDLAEATLNLLDADSQGIVHVTNLLETTWYEFSVAILKEFGIRGDLTPTSTADWLMKRPKQARRPKYSVLDTSDYTAATGMQLRGWPAALKEFRFACEKQGECS